MADMTHEAYIESILAGHLAWHNTHGTSTVAAGYEFLRFHRQDIIAPYNTWRAAHGLPSVAAWTPPSPAPPLPAEFVLGTGLENFAAAGEIGMAIDGWHGDVHCAGFPQDREVPGSTLSAVLCNVFQAPRNRYFWGLHKFIDNIWATWETLVPDCFIRDSLADTGDPQPVAMNSPDIICRQSVSPDPLAEFGGANWTFGGFSQSVEAGQDNYIYLRVQNRGTRADNIAVSVYYCPMGTFSDPTLWTLIGSLPISHVLPGQRQVAGPLIWSSANIPATGHYCFVAVLGSTGDPAPDPMQIGVSISFTDYVRLYNNVAWKNFDVVDLLPNTLLPMRIGAGRGLEGPFSFQILREKVPARAEIVLHMQEELAKRFKLRGERLRPTQREGWVAVELGGREDDQLPRIPLKADEYFPLELEVNLPLNTRPVEFVIALRQMQGREEVGRVTYLLRWRQDQPYHLLTREPRSYKPFKLLNFAGGDFALQDVTEELRGRAAFRLAGRDFVAQAGPAVTFRDLQRRPPLAEPGQ